MPAVGPCVAHEPMTRSPRIPPVARECYSQGMAATISQRELRNDSGAIMRRVEQGESFVVTRNGVPVADLLPHDAARTRGPQRFVAVDTIAEGVAELASWGVDRFRRELAELDSVLDDRDVDRWSSGA